MNVKITPGKGCDTWLGTLGALGSSAEGIAKMAVYDGAGIVADAIKAAAPRDTGALAASLGISKIKSDGDRVGASISFAGTDRDGRPNILKARALEHGTPRMKPHPFVAKAAKSKKEAALAAMKSTAESAIKKMVK
ncbi:MAG: HK97 gp10 family phage protein [Clostridiales Family XIII bacterium]|jgi:HK97 gp10 family phage protein|nr:HK97 gp10 family phage protein [Clostridiales Family XIII bacterium]